MTSRREILWSHYTRLVKKTAAWAGMLALLATSMVAFPAHAANQLTSRSTTLSSSASAATGVTYTFGFTLNASQTLGSVKVEICDSPLSTTACANTGNSSGATFTGATFGSMSLGTGWSLGTCTGNACIVTHTAASLSGAATLVINNVTNPNSGANKQYYTRISTYTDTAATTPAYPGTDFGATAVSTAAQITVAANVQESLSFCVYTGVNCAAAGSTVNIGTGADNVLSSSSTSGGVSYMDAATNATTGYVITYITTTIAGHPNAGLTSTNDTITDAGGSAVGAPSAGTARFGINLVANTTGLTPAGALGAAPSGGTGQAVAPYATADNIAFQSGTTPRTIANSNSTPSVNTKFTVTYAAQAGNTTKPGAYSALFTYVATGTF